MLRKVKFVKIIDQNFQRFNKTENEIELCEVTQNILKRTKLFY